MSHPSRRAPRASRLAVAVRHALATSVFMAMTTAAGAAAPDEGIIRLNARLLDPASKEADALRDALPKSHGRQLHLVQYQGPIQRRWYESLTATGVEIVDFIPDYTYLVYGDALALSRVRDLGRSQDNGVRWEGHFAGELKINARVYELESKGVQPDFYTIQLVADPAVNAETLALIRGADFGESRVWPFRHYVNVEARVPFGALSAIANRPDVISIQPDMTPTLLDERQNLILANRLTTSGSNTVPIAPGDPGGIGYLDWLTSLGFTQAQFDASGFSVDVSDQGLDNGTTQPMHFALWQGGDPGSPLDPARSLVVYNKQEGTASATDLTGCGGIGHGTWTSHVVSGSVASVARGFPHGDGSFHYAGGVAPFVRIGNSVFFTTGGTFTNPNVVNSTSRAYSNLGTNVNGARISNNSWGAAVSGAYNANSQAYDGLVRDAQPTGSTHPAPGNQEYVVVVSAGNSGPGTQTMGAPATGKNVIAVGGSQNVRPGIGDAVNADAMYASSSRGPTADGRIKPDLIAPATNIAGGVVMNDRSTAPPGNWNTCYTGPFLPTSPVQQRFYRVGNGTSFSGPAVAGAAALLRQWFINQSLAPPSPAMTKAYLANTASYMATLTDNLPSNNQGMGRMNLERAFDATPRGLRDQLPADRFTDSGQVRSFRGTVADTGKPFRVTLAWTDVPGSTTGNTFVNNLDLRVTIGGQTYLGNRFSGANSTTGGTPDPRNNMESVFLPAGVSGPFNITVAATNVSAPADPTITGPNQDFALKVYNTSTLTECPEFAITPATVPTNVVGGVAYPAQNFSASGGTSPYAWSVAGTLPPGLTLTPAGVLSGTPTTPGTYNFSVTASDADGCAGGRGYQITVISAQLEQTTRTLTTGNGILEPNECNDLSIRLTNTGTNAATAITSVLSSTTPGVTIAQPNSPYPDLAAGGGNALNIDAFQISTDSTVACGSTVNLTQTVTLTGGGSPVTFNFSIPVGQAGGNYTFGTPGTGAVIPPGGTLVPGSNADDALVDVTIPFATAIYDQAVASGTVVRVSTNGNVQFTPTGGSTAFSNTALPATAFGATVPVLLPFWDDLDLRTTGGGIYTQTVGTAPNRQFIIEWRGRHFSESSGPQSVNFAVVLNEGASGAFEYRYVQTGAAAAIANGASATVGVQKANAGTDFTQSSFNQPVVTPDRVLPATLPPPICSPGPGVCTGGDLLFQNGFEQAP